MIRRLRFGAALIMGLAAAPGLCDSQALPFELGGPFVLTGHDGALRTEADPAGRHQLLFFGYAGCEQICSAALPLMADAVRALAADGIALSPMMITVDPETDTPEVMAAALSRHHPDFLGLTGSEAALEAAYDAFRIERSYLFTDPYGTDVYAHGSFLYLLSPDGRVLTFLPPVMDGAALTATLRGYLEGS